MRGFRPSLPPSSGPPNVAVLPPRAMNGQFELQLVRMRFLTASFRATHGSLWILLDLRGELVAAVSAPSLLRGLAGHGSGCGSLVHPSPGSTRM